VQIFTEYQANSTRSYSAWRSRSTAKQSNSADEDEDDDLSAVWTELCGEWEFEEVDGEPSEGMSFSRLLADMQREEEVEQRKQKAQDGEVDTGETVVFEMNHPYVTAGDTDDQQMDGKAFVHMIERLIRWYRHRWGIENGFKKQKALHGANHLD
jgi:IS4 transposase